MQGPKGEGPHPSTPGPPGYPKIDLQRMWAQREQFVQLAPQHQVLARLAGVWKVKTNFDFGGYGPNFSAEGRQISTLIHNGRFLESRLQVQFAGHEYSSFSVTGFDTVVGKFQTVIFDTDTNGMANLEGDWEEATESIREFGEISNPMFRTRHDIALHRKFSNPDKVKIRVSVPDMEGKFFDYLVADLTREKS